MEARPPIELFGHCPRCGVAMGARDAVHRIRCGACGLVYYFNPTVSAVAFIFRGDGRVLFVRRTKEPAKGRLGPPGGFIDIGERAEVAVEREVMEEVNLRLERVRFLCSQPNRYAYLGVEYPVLDLYFTARATDPERAQALDEVEDVQWLDPRAVDPEELAFPSMGAALRVLMERV